jgi:hypothetical protein
VCVSEIVSESVFVYVCVCLCSCACVCVCACVFECASVSVCVCMCKLTGLRLTKYVQRKLTFGCAECRKFYTKVIHCV